MWYISVTAVIIGIVLAVIFPVKNDSQPANWVSLNLNNWTCTKWKQETFSDYYGKGHYPIERTDVYCTEYTKN